MSQGTPAQSQQRLQIHIIICDQMPKLFPDEKHGSSYAELFRRLFSGAAERLNVPVAFDEWDAVEGRLPPFLEDDAENRHLYVISGSKSDSFGSDPWIVAFRAYVKEAIGRGLRFMGVCFGHQVIAYSLGGDVHRGPEGFWGGGERTVNVVDPLIAGLAGQDHLRLSVVHFDMVTRLPPGATLVGTSPEVTNDSYRIGTQVLTFQGHPELYPDFLNRYIDVFCGNLPEEKVAQAKETLKVKTDSSLVAEVAIRFFLQ